MQRFLSAGEGTRTPRREALDPKSSVSTNFTTPAINLDGHKYR